MPLRCCCSLFVSFSADWRCWWWWSSLRRRIIHKDTTHISSTSSFFDLFSFTRYFHTLTPHEEYFYIKCTHHFNSSSSSPSLHHVFFFLFRLDLSVGLTTSTWLRRSPLPGAPFSFPPMGILFFIYNLPQSLWLRFLINTIAPPRRRWARWAKDNGFVILLISDDTAEFTGCVQLDWYVVVCVRGPIWRRILFFTTGRTDPAINPCCSQEQGSLAKHCLI